MLRLPAWRANRPRRWSDLELAEGAGLDPARLAEARAFAVVRDREGPRVSITTASPGPRTSSEAGTDGG